TAAPVREHARGAGQAGAHVEDAREPSDAGPAGQRVDGVRPAVVVLVQVEEIFGRHRGARRHAAAPQGRHHLGLADGVAVVEIEEGRVLMAHATYDKSEPFPTARGRGSLMSSFKEGLEDVVVSTSEICFIDGREGRLLYRGFDVDDLAAHSSFEEVVYLLWHGALPSRKELDTQVKALSATANRRLPPKLV